MLEPEELLSKRGRQGGEAKYDDYGQGASAWKQSQNVIFKHMYKWFSLLTKHCQSGPNLKKKDGVKIWD